MRAEVVRRWFFTLCCLTTAIPAFAAKDPAAPPPDSLARRLAGVDGLLRLGEWSLAEEASRWEIGRSRQGLSASVLAAGLARLAVAEAGLAREEAIWHWQVAQSLDRNVLSEEALRTFGAAGELLSRHPLRPAGQAPPDLEVHGLGATVQPPRKAAGELPEPSVALRSLSVPLWIRAQLVIDAEGRPRDPVILGASLPGLAFEVLEAVRGWRFEPARKEGRPVAAFYQLSLNPLAEKPLSEIARSSHPVAAELDSLLRAGRWDDAARKARQLWVKSLSSLPGWNEMGYFLALRALAEAGLGARDEAICHWQAAQHLDPGLYHANLAAYGAAGRLLEANRWGTLLEDGDPTTPSAPPALVKTTRVHLRVRTPISVRFLVSGIIDSSGHVRQPVLWASQQLPPFGVEAVWRDMREVRESPMERMVAMSALESVCSWRFEPARSEDRLSATASLWTVGVDNRRGLAAFGGFGAFPHPEFGQGPSSPHYPKGLGETAVPH